MLDKSYLDLAELVEQQGQIIKDQSETIAKLVNENTEQENMINTLMRKWVWRTAGRYCAVS